MREELLYAFAAAGVLAVGRWFSLLVVRCFAGTRRARRFVLAHVVETITDPAFQERVAAETRRLVEDFDAAVDKRDRRPAPPQPLRLTRPRG